MREIDKIAEGLFEKIRDRYEDVSLGDEKAKATTDPEKARFFNFDYVVDGENHGNITMSLIDETSLKVYFSKNISKDLDDEQKKEWYSFLRELREFARRNLLSFEPRDITRSTLKHRDIQQQSKADSTYDKDEVVAESRLYGTSKSSYQKFGPARIIVRHDKHVTDESRGERSRHINSIYVENHEGERFKMPFKSLTASRAMARHISAGGTPHDDLGQHITEMAVETAKLKPFLNNVRHRMFEDEETKTMVEAAFDYHKLLKNTLHRMSGKKGYTACKEQFVATSTSYVPEEDVDLNEIKERFVKRVFNEKMEDALPLVHKAYTMKKENKFTEQFENWATAVSEGSWALPQTEEDKQQLIDILSQELPVGVDAQNATNILYNIFGDDKLFDRLEELADVDPEADVRDAVMERLSEVNPQMYQAILDAIGDEDTPEPESEIGEGNTYGSGDSGMDGTVYEEDDQDDLLANIESIQSAIIRRILNSINDHSELLKKAGPEGIMNAASDVASFHAPMEEIGSSDISIMVREVYNEVGVEYPELTEERDIEDSEQVCVYCGDPRDDKLGCCDENHFISKKEFDQDNEVTEAKDKVTYDPKTGKLTGWEHEGDWKKQTKKKDPVGKIHHMSDVARRRTEKMSKDETLEETFERLVNEGAINVGDIIRDKTNPEIQGEVVPGDQDENYVIKVDDEHYHILKLNAEVVKKGLLEADSKFMAYLEPLIGQQVYLPAEGKMGTIVGPSPNPKLPAGIQAKLDNGQMITTAPGRFKAQRPGPLQQAIDKFNALTGKIDPIPAVAKSYGTVAGPMDNLYKQDWSSVKEDIKKLAGL
jgi:hypothetical protein